MGFYLGEVKCYFRCAFIVVLLIWSNCFVFLFQIIGGVIIALAMLSQVLTNVNGGGDVRTKTQTSLLSLQNKTKKQNMNLSITSFASSWRVGPPASSSSTSWAPLLWWSPSWEPMAPTRRAKRVWSWWVPTHGATKLQNKRGHKADDKIQRTTDLVFSNHNVENS